MTVEAVGPESLITWAERNAPGRELEIFEGNRSLGRLRFSPETRVWTIAAGPRRVAG